MFKWHAEHGRNAAASSTRCRSSFSGFNWTLAELSGEVRGLAKRVRRANVGMFNFFFHVGTSGMHKTSLPSAPNELISSVQGQQNGIHKAHYQLHCESSLPYAVRQYSSTLGV